MQVTVMIATKPSQFVSGTVAGNWRIELSRPSDPSTIAFEYEGPSSSTTFDLTEGDVFNARGCRLDAAGSALGPIATNQFTVGADLVVLDVADTISAATSLSARRR